MTLQRLSQIDKQKWLFKKVAIDLDADVWIGDNVTITPFTNIGYPGFGFEVKDPKSTKPEFILPLKRKEHNYGVVIHDNVEIGSSVTIDRGSWRNTVIGEGTKIESLVNIGHNTTIGKNSIIVSGAIIGGSCTIGDNAYIGISAGVKQRITIGNNAVVGMCANVIRDVPEYTTVVGNPARILRQEEKPKEDEIEYTLY